MATNGPSNFDKRYNFTDGVKAIEAIFEQSEKAHEPTIDPESNAALKKEVDKLTAISPSMMTVYTKPPKARLHSVPHPEESPYHRRELDLTVRIPKRVRTLLEPTSTEQLSLTAAAAGKKKRKAIVEP